MASKIDFDPLTLSRGGIACTLSTGLARSDSFPLSVIGDRINSLESREGGVSAGHSYKHIRKQLRNLCLNLKKKKMCFLYSIPMGPTGSLDGNLG